MANYTTMTRAPCIQGATLSPLYRNWVVFLPYKYHHNSRCSHPDDFTMDLSLDQKTQPNSSSIGPLSIPYFTSEHWRHCQDLYFRSQHMAESPVHVPQNNHIPNHNVMDKPPRIQHPRISRVTECKAVQGDNLLQEEHTRHLITPLH
ncbi:hypothetical protein PIB30_045695 [Stylosanthes scabra]|uniref:Uncharacterized protein n=1 Tax=Stylosanthes scabra TaxID=79078 RepID=A0ABU6TH88_9FABA|nr:hypothetical protein [Stylosanthes scabra]